MKINHLIFITTVVLCVLINTIYSDYVTRDGDVSEVTIIVEENKKYVWFKTPDNVDAVFYEITGDMHISLWTALIAANMRDPDNNNLHITYDYWNDDGNSKKDFDVPGGGGSSLIKVIKIQNNSDVNLDDGDIAYVEIKKEVAGLYGMHFGKWQSPNYYIPITGAPNVGYMFNLLMTNLSFAHDNAEDAYRYTNLHFDTETIQGDFEKVKEMWIQTQNSGGGEAIDKIKIFPDYAETAPNMVFIIAGNNDVFKFEINGSFLHDFWFNSILTEFMLNIRESSGSRDPYLNISSHLEQDPPSDHQIVDNIGIGNISIDIDNHNVSYGSNTFPLQGSSVEDYFLNLLLIYKMYSDNPNIGLIINDGGIGSTITKMKFDTNIGDIIINSETNEMTLADGQVYPIDGDIQRDYLYLFSVAHLLEQLNDEQ